MPCLVRLLFWENIFVETYKDRKVERQWQACHTSRPLQECVVSMTTGHIKRLDRRRYTSWNFHLKGFTSLFEKFTMPLRSWTHNASITVFRNQQRLNFQRAFLVRSISENFLKSPAALSNKEASVSPCVCLRRSMSWTTT